MKNGDKVMIAKTSEFYVEDDDWNPMDVIGEVSDNRSDICNELPIIVVWDNGTDSYGDVRTNSYSEKDLVVIG